MRTFKYTFTVQCTGTGNADTQRVEQLIDLAMQDLVFDDEFIAALDEREAVTIEVTPGVS
jgi:hypothetical protein